MNPSIQSAINSAVNSLKEPEALNVTKAGGMQIERTGSGDVQGLIVGKARNVDPKRIDGNISGDEFDRLW